MEQSSHHDAHAAPQLSSQLSLLRNELDDTTRQLQYYSSQGDNDYMAPVVVELTQLRDLLQARIRDAETDELVALGCRVDSDLHRGASDDEAGPDVGGIGGAHAAELVGPGQRCRAPFANRDGSVSYHDAVIFSGGDDERQDSPLLSTATSSRLELGASPASPPHVPSRAWVLFATPTTEAMLTCAAWLETGKCPDLASCLHGHGFEVETSLLRPYRPADPKAITTLERDSECLVCPVEGGLWHKGVILQVDAGLNRSAARRPNDDQSAPTTTVLVRLVAANSVVSVRANQVLPAQPSSGETESQVSGQLEPARGNPENVTTTLAASTVGDWERFTNAIGSRLLMKMGWKPGEGIGAQRQGRAAPIVVNVLPPGKSLDVCMALREQRKLPTVDSLPAEPIDGPSDASTSTGLPLLGANVSARYMALSRDQRIMVQQERHRVQAKAAVRKAKQDNAEKRRREQLIRSEMGMFGVLGSSVSSALGIASTPLPTAASLANSSSAKRKYF
ncbi:hypothetical protein CAOG_00037 [Capsaspora owczarzaki ATCC 30864]|uniref:G-patch domain-containing protein n=1 Tax=Capsaspora owczarzaki (strain ATCC 30864) TaxID=595528 RepID=A0A0D2WG82_CAPO3|nr:hypothetical protein CAOG_00037 [Capsaspora owczarzaki ATCC 30864]KJE88375.1 hypothetical protein CAOG_000037 [Capsaspora owczarzaki ATCC 30864]|eukprot:XP_004364908.1 hypothetical protein CAOG_00037 [Capsaspora owczarzaki ATCC 30864]